MEPRRPLGRETGAPAPTPEEQMRQRAFKAALKELGLTQAAAATKLGVPGGKARISEWERGRRPIPPYITAHIETMLVHHALKTEVMARFKRGQHRRRGSEGDA